MKFPDKVQMEKDPAHIKSNSFIPKLDLSKVNEKYNIDNSKKVNVFIDKNNNNNTIIKPIITRENNIIVNNKPIDEIKTFKKENTSLLNKIEKLKTKLDKYKARFKELKEKYNDLKIKFKFSGNKINQLEEYLRKSSQLQTTEYVSDNKADNNDNISMVYLIFFIILI